MSVCDTSTSPHARVRSLGLSEVRWTDGFWADLALLTRSSIVPAMGRLMLDEDRVRFVGNFEVACGIKEGRHRGPRWNDGDFFKWLEAAAALFALQADPALDRQMDELIALIAKTQERDGYIHTDVQIRQHAGEAIERFGNPMDFEMYNMGHLIQAAIVHHRATSKTNLLEIAKKSADYLDHVFANPVSGQARHGICPTHLMSLVELSRETKDRKYLSLAERLLAMRELVETGDDDNQDRLPLREHRTAHGHAVRATYLYSGAADIYLENGDSTLLPSLLAVWDDLVARKLYITGGCGALFDGASPDGAADQKVITRIHQAFGRNYQLPQSTAHNETCAAIGNLMWNWRLYQITGEPRFVDLIESTLFNSVLAGMSLDGTEFFYTNTLRQLDPMPVELRWSRQRQRVMGCYCCPPNVARTLAESSHYAYARTDDAIDVLLYGSNTLQVELPIGAVRLAQRSNYPWDGAITITVETAPASSWALRLRIPEWVDGATVSINGQSSAAPLAGAFYEIRREWKAGDVVALDLPMPVRLVEANPLIEEAVNQIAVLRGPLVYCLESVDLPLDVKLLQVRLPGDPSAYRVGSPMEKLRGAVPIEVHASVQEASPWGNALYREVGPGAFQSIDARLIPYYAWGNRGQSEMSVWMPVQWSQSSEVHR